MRRREIYLAGILGVLLAVAAYYFFGSRGQGTALPGVLSADTKFQPLDVQEPALRIDLLEKIRKYEPTGSRRNIFVAVPPAPKVMAHAEAPRPFVGPRPLPPPPPLQVP